MKHGWIVIGALLLFVSCAPAQKEPVPWPTTEWPVSSPEQQDMDEARLVELDESLATEYGNIDGMLVIRNGHVVYEKSYVRDYDALYEGREQTPGQYNYYDPDWHPYYQRGKLHTMQSVTKSVTSALIGIAIGRGEIAGVEVPVIDFLEGYELGEVSDWKRSMTLEDLLTMRAGIQWDESTVPYTDPANSCAAMEASEDWVQYVVEQPMAHEPGTVFNYNSGASHLLSLILEKSTAEYVDEYAEEHLFGPIGIKSYYWKKTPKGYPDTEGGLYLHPRDLARFGYLYLMEGVWEGARILPEGWIQDSVELRTRNTGSGLGYGYQWWLTPWGNGQSSYAYTCLGYGGQRLFVVPEHDLVAVFTGWNIYGTPALNVHFALSSLIDAVNVMEED